MSSVRCSCSNLSNFNYKPQAESQQQHFALYMYCLLLSLAIIIEVTSRHMECTHFNLAYSQMPAVALPSLKLQIFEDGFVDG